MRNLADEVVPMHFCINYVSLDLWWLHSAAVRRIGNTSVQKAIAADLSNGLKFFTILCAKRFDSSTGIKIPEFTTFYKIFYP